MQGAANRASPLLASRNNLSVGARWCGHLGMPASNRSLNRFALNRINPSLFVAHRVHAALPANMVPLLNHEGWQTSTNGRRPTRASTRHQASIRNLARP